MTLRKVKTYVKRNENLLTFPLFCGEQKGVKLYEKIGIRKWKEAGPKFVNTNTIFNNLRGIL